MKALIISEDTSFVQAFSTFFKNNCIDIIVYKWLLKALDNIEEIAPDVIILNTAEYPRHWKTLVQFAKSGIGSEKVCVFLYEPVPLSNEDFMKAEALDVNGAFSDLSDNTLSGILSEINRFFGNTVEPVEKNELPSGDVCNEDNNTEIEVQFMFTDPGDNSFIHGKGMLCNSTLICKNLNAEAYSLNQIINKVTFKENDINHFCSAIVFAKQSDSIVLQLKEKYERQ